MANALGGLQWSIWSSLAMLFIQMSVETYSVSFIIENCFKNPWFAIYTNAAAMIVTLYEANHSHHACLIFDYVCTVSGFFEFTRWNAITKYKYSDRRHGKKGKPIAWSMQSLHLRDRTNKDWISVQTAIDMHGNVESGPKFKRLRILPLDDSLSVVVRSFHQWLAACW